MALRSFAGGSYLDIQVSHGVGKTDFYRSIWAIVDAVNSTPDLDFRFPSTEDECRANAAEFALRAQAGFTNCVGCIDGVLLWIESPTRKNAKGPGLTVANSTVVAKENTG